MWPVNMTCNTEGWPVNSSISPNIARWPAIILNPAANYFQQATIFLSLSPPPSPTLMTVLFFVENIIKHLITHKLRELDRNNMLDFAPFKVCKSKNATCLQN